MRDIAVLQSTGKHAANTAFEGRVEREELDSGPVGPPSNAMSMTSYGAHRVITIRVLRSYRGQAEGLVTVVTGTGGGDCGFDFETSKQYLVYANAAKGGIFFTSICSGTAAIEEAQPALRYLRGEAPSADDLLDRSSYYQKFSSQHTGTVCGRVTKPDGGPLGRAQVVMTQVQDEPLPPRTASDPDLSKPDGSFCVKFIQPGHYLLTAEANDYTAGTRWMGYYAGVAKHSEATSIGVAPGETLNDIHFTAQQQQLYTVRFRIAIPNDRSAPWANLGIAIESPDRDPLAYHEHHGVGHDGSYTLGLIPPGHYLVSTFIQEGDGLEPGPTMWQMAKQEVDINGDGEVVLNLIPKSGP